MAHARKTIRSAIAAILNTSPVTWSAVTESRIESQRQIWPYLMVFAESEVSDIAAVNNPSIYSRTVNITVAGMLRLPGTSDTYTVEDKMDTMAAEIETKLTQTIMRAIVSAVQSIHLVSTAMNVIIEEDGIDHAELNMTWRVTYWIAEGLPEVFI